MYYEMQRSLSDLIFGAIELQPSVRLTAAIQVGAAVSCALMVSSCIKVVALLAVGVVE